MKDIEEFYINGLPIETDIGNCKFLKVKEYPDYVHELSTIAMSKEGLINKYRDMNKSGELNDYISKLEQMPFYAIVLALPELQMSYDIVFSKVFDLDEPFNHITEENFYYLRQLVLKMNCMKEEKINPNPEIQRAIERSRRVKNNDKETTSFADIVTSIVGFNGIKYQDINDFTMYQLYMTYYRIAAIKSYDTSTLFATVSTDKVKIDSWGKHIDIFEEEKHSVSKDEFKHKSNNLFGDSQ